MGLFKKLAIADRMACLVDPVYQFPGQYSTSAVWVAVIAYSLQIYCDFSGYSDIAIGTAHMLGFKLPENFDMPYLSKNIAEFWRRWHISLSTWLRDYVFISMGGSRGTEIRTVFTLMSTMTLCGLWHGAKWTFVGFGVVQGLMMLAHRYFNWLCKVWPGLKAFLQTRFGMFLCVLVTYWTFIVSLVVFRSQDFATVGEMYKRLFTSQPGMMVRHPIGPWGLFFSFVVVAIAHGIASQGNWRKIAARMPLSAWGFAYAAALALICVIRIEGQKAFIYFQF
jgi:alginate O-acetyltransferase complex protein AlgI